MPMRRGLTWLVAFTIGIKVRTACSGFIDAFAERSATSGMASSRPRPLQPESEHCDMKLAQLSRGAVLLGIDAGSLHRTALRPVQNQSLAWAVKPPAVLGTGSAGRPPLALPNTGGHVVEPWWNTQVSLTRVFSTVLLIALLCLAVYGIMRVSSGGENKGQGAESADDKHAHAAYEDTRQSIAPAFRKAQRGPLGPCFAPCGPCGWDPSEDQGRHRKGSSPRRH